MYVLLTVYSVYVNWRKWNCDLDSGLQHKLFAFTNILYKSIIFVLFFWKPDLPLKVKDHKHKEAL